MPLTEKQMKQYLAIYGTESEQWPEPMRTYALQPRHHALLSRLVIEQQYVDEVMLSHRPFEKPDPDLAARIIYSARTVQRTQGMKPVIWFREFFSSVLPRPAVAFAAMVTLGLAIGFELPLANIGNNTILQPFMEDDGSIL